jgi:hypothetical protein
MPLLLAAPVAQSIACHQGHDIRRFHSEFFAYSSSSSWQNLAPLPATRDCEVRSLSDGSALARGPHVYPTQLPYRGVRAARLLSVHAPIVRAASIQKTAKIMVPSQKPTCPHPTSITSRAQIPAGRLQHDLTIPSRCALADGHVSPAIRITGVYQARLAASARSTFGGSSKVLRPRLTAVRTLDGTFQRSGASGNSVPGHSMTPSCRPSFFETASKVLATSVRWHSFGILHAQKKISLACFDAQSS